MQVNIQQSKWYDRKGKLQCSRGVLASDRLAYWWTDGSYFMGKQFVPSVYVSCSVGYYGEIIDYRCFA